ncbi:DNA topoisomerase IB [Pulveribacter suum]|uniref:DNA topoisomerase n=1 Tax=Pulveribacter suum TaxID=2116657 RepID=A0A2P1NPX4_9BURK|nr:DNA topoisomerase IB [Pulveribacter suum]AVP59109.1 DNA topoisomerase [Pulveribacter suum]
MASSTATAPAKPPRLPAGLVYVDRSVPGITRVRQGDTFRYRTPAGDWLQDEEHLAHIRRLAIPPAYTDVWICPRPEGHLQATGRDARGRLQYRYHPDWRRVRDGSKFERMRAFGQALPRIRRQVARDLQSCGKKTLSRQCVLAAIVRLLDTTFVRVGNEEYAVANGSYGLTTLRTRHAAVRGASTTLRFRGKSGVQQQAELEDPRVARVVRRCQQLPGQELFQWQEDDGELRSVGSSDVNAYLAQMTGEAGHFTAKDFRTWHGTVQALELTRVACSRAQGEDAPPARGVARQILVEVARQLGNTPAVCRKSYVHPAVLALGESLASDAGPGLQRVWQRLGRTGASPRGLSAAERRLLAFLRHPPRAPRAQTKDAPRKRPGAAALAKRPAGAGKQLAARASRRGKPAAPVARTAAAPPPARARTAAAAAPA